MKTLLLNFDYQPISFLSFRKVFKLIVKGKVDVLSSWDSFVHWGRGKMPIPAVIRLKYYVRWIPRKLRYNRMNVFRRDNFTCQYCGKGFKPGELTLDHIIPRSKGGVLNWLNSVASCFECNNKKRNRTPEQAGMYLLNRPRIPNIDLKLEIMNCVDCHPDWKMYLGY